MIDTPLPCLFVSHGPPNMVLDDIPPRAARAHPTEEHYLPPPVVMGAGGADGQGAVLHRSFSYGSLPMAIHAFGVAK